VKVNYNKKSWKQFFRFLGKVKYPLDTNLFSTESITTVYKEWASWMNCSMDCGRAEKLRQREVLFKYLGKINTTKLQDETLPCNEHVCSDNLCQDYSEWTECSKACGGGVQQRNRTCNESGSLFDDSQPRECNNIPCLTLSPVTTSTSTSSRVKTTTTIKSSLTPNTSVTSETKRKQITAVKTETKRKQITAVTTETKRKQITAVTTETKRKQITAVTTETKSKLNKQLLTKIYLDIEICRYENNEEVTTRLSSTKRIGIICGVFLIFSVTFCFALVVVVWSRTSSKKKIAPSIQSQDVDTGIYSDIKDITGNHVIVEIPLNQLKSTSSQSIETPLDNNYEQLDDGHYYHCLEKPKVDGGIYDNMMYDSIENNKQYSDINSFGSLKKKQDIYDLVENMEDDDNYNSYPPYTKLQPQKTIDIHSNQQNILPVATTDNSTNATESSYYSMAVGHTEQPDDIEKLYKKNKSFITCSREKTNDYAEVDNIVQYDIEEPNYAYLDIEVNNKPVNNSQLNTLKSFNDAELTSYTKIESKNEGILPYSELNHYTLDPLKENHYHELQPSYYSTAYSSHNLTSDKAETCYYSTAASNDNVAEDDFSHLYAKVDKSKKMVEAVEYAECSNVQAVKTSTNVKSFSTAQPIEDCYSYVDDIEVKVDTNKGKTESKKRNVLQKIIRNRKK